jgi:pSer/pThr/pTyr-binding forkhead associated (FHA) protein
MQLSADMGGFATGRLAGEQTPLNLSGAQLNLHVVRSGQIVPLGGAGEYIVGRVSDGQSILPDIDLEPYNAYEAGVSRLHARIKIDQGSMWITDLGSANGTRLNNQKLSPHHEYPLSDKDLLRFGRLSLQALVGES